MAKESNSKIEELKAKQALNNNFVDTLRKEVEVKDKLKALLYAKLGQATQTLLGAKQTGKVSFNGKQKWDYFQLPDIFAKLKIAEMEYKFFVEINEGNPFVNETQWIFAETKGQILAEGHIQVNVIDLETGYTLSYPRIKCLGSNTDQAKAKSGAITYGLRTFLIKLFKMEDGLDIAALKSAEEQGLEKPKFDIKTGEVKVHKTVNQQVIKPVVKPTAPTPAKPVLQPETPPQPQPEIDLDSQWLDLIGKPGSQKGAALVHGLQKLAAEKQKEVSKWQEWITPEEKALLIKSAMAVK